MSLLAFPVCNFLHTSCLYFPLLLICYSYYQYISAQPPCSSAYEACVCTTTADTHQQLLFFPFHPAKVCPLPYTHTVPHSPIRHPQTSTSVFTKSYFRSTLRLKVKTVAQSLTFGWEDKSLPFAPFYHHRKSFWQLSVYCLCWCLFHSAPLAGFDTIWNNLNIMVLSFSQVSSIGRGSPSNLVMTEPVAPRLSLKAWMIIANSAHTFHEYFTWLCWQLWCLSFLHKFWTNFLIFECWDLLEKEISILILHLFTASHMF